ncbi:nucleotidyltransferase domain-containing protein [Thermosynechococcaceae cyanobacterium BACA0444]|uniref:Nucleotidyltransferase domain-containing protein n=1 Tax=Pseudocalidococcus azoricus BACA0444 TaxID=2918990 RepID=A0AAE4FQ78_9CYAN|nr:nucleotidyltransferase domain-containing protein [Pseudocalidococcus azoricus]MDS3859658.1 nucleotidyltransferase domain-containing protein [Pseudocalidococcus azoricus BACA0444]
MATTHLSSDLEKKLGIKTDQLTKFCQTRQIIELALFGSILRDDFHPDSDLDLLVTFDPTAKISLLDLVDMEFELEAICQRNIDLITKRAIEASPNWIRRQEILTTATVIYESRSSLST